MNKLKCHGCGDTLARHKNEKTHHKIMCMNCLHVSQYNVNRKFSKIMHLLLEHERTAPAVDIDKL